MAKNWLSKLQALEGAVIGDYNPHDHVIRTPSPSTNAIFGKGWGLPLGYTMVLYGPPKAGKSVLSYAMIGQMQKDYSDGVAIKFDTEFREEGQLPVEEAVSLYGIDKSRYQAYSVNSPVLVFDRIEQEFAAMCQEGMPLKLVIIDSITGVQGRRAMNADSISVQQMGDNAATIQEGLKRILPIQRKYRFSLILTAHVRAEMDPNKAKYVKTKMAGAWGLQHFSEYFVAVSPHGGADGTKDEAGNTLEDKSKKDAKGEADQTGHKIYVKMADSSMGPKKRSGEFTFDYKRGIINQHEEIFLLGKNRGGFQRPNNTTYLFGDRKFVGAGAAMEAIKDDPKLGEAILAEVKRKDNSNAFASEDAAAEAETEE
jgi:RecA/RadA recombinase